MFNAEVLLVVLVCSADFSFMSHTKWSSEAESLYWINVFYMYLVTHQLHVTAVPQEILRAENDSLLV